MRSSLQSVRTLKLRYVEAFARYGAKLRDKTWSLCAVAPDKSLVISLWAGKFKRGGKYVDNLSRVSGYHTHPGSHELSERLQTALLTKQPIRAISLSEREFQIFCKLAAGQKVTHIYSGLSLSLKTVSTCRARIMQRMQMSRNAELTYYAIKHELIN